MPQYVCNGAMLKCSCGLAPSTLVVLPDKMVMESSQPAANIMDNKPMINILPFGMCQSIANPTVAAATSAAMGVLTPMPCIPATVIPWMPGKPTVLIKNMPALTSDSKLTCMWAGMIEITSPGQFVSSDGAGGSGGSGASLGALNTENLEKPKPCTRESIAMHEAIDKMYPPGSPANIQAHELVNKYVGHPVNVANGNFFTKQEDFTIPGVIPLVWERRYFSNSWYEGPMGFGWHHSYDWALNVSEKDRLVLVRMGDGRIAMFDNIPLNSSDPWRYNRAEKLYLARHSDGHYFLRDRENKELNFSVMPLRGKEHLLTSISNTSGFAIRFRYDRNALLSEIVDTAGRIIRVESNRKGRISAIHAPHPTEEGKIFPIASYEYDSDGDLVKQTNVAGHSMRFEYKRHLMVKETWRNGLNWYFVYDGKKTGAKCIETWGDGDILHYHLKYEEGVTHSTNSLGHKTSYYHKNGIVIKQIDANGAEWLSNYNEYDELEWESDALGNLKSYVLDELGNIITDTDATGGCVKTKYLENNFIGLPVEVIDPNGGKWTWEYNVQGKLTKRVDPIGATTRFEYSDGLLVQVIDAKENRTAIQYDRYHNLQKVSTPDGLTSEWKYDNLGRCIEVVDPKGNSRRFRLDMLGRPLEVLEPDGNKRQFVFDQQDNIIRASDKHQDVSFRYNGMGSLVSRSENNTSIQFKYDNEDQLISILNEHGLRYTFALDPVGKVIAETGFDGISRSYLRDLAGQVIKVLRPGKLETEYQYDAGGRVVTVTHSDGSTELFKYQLGGELLEAANENATVRFERDPLGRVIKESTGDNWVKSVFDELGNRIAVSSSLGADISHEYNRRGDALELNAGHWKTLMKRDEFGLETERLLPGGISSQWQRDSLGRPITHNVGAVGHTRHRTYRWDVNDRLKEITDNVSGTRQFTHDAFGNLASTIYGNGMEELRLPDAVGNLFRTQDRRDRKYGPAGQLLEANGTHYSYDLEGNLVEKREINGSSWKYEWNASGMLKFVTRPDGSIIEFTYDALGRRLGKSYRNTVTRWVWDGNTPLHEWKEDFRSGKVLSDSTIDKDGIITWVFEADSFVPAAKLKGDKTYSIVADHLGTPFQMYNSEGHKFWECELDSYGKVRISEGDKGSCPFRYQGQYEDAETGLYYNRFRYYNPDDGVYISKDPIRLGGGTLNIYYYVKDNNTWVDPFGLASANAGIAPKHGSTGHNDIIDSQIKQLQNDPSITDIRKNQQQVDINGKKVGNNRPDIQYNKDGVHYNVEFDTSTRGSNKHQREIPQNDPNARNTFWKIDDDGNVETGHSISNSSSCSS